MIFKIRNYIKNFLFIFLSILFSSNIAMSAGDTRKVTQPIIPNNCDVLKATNENMTLKIQKGMDKCAALKKVLALDVNGKNFHFFSGPLSIPSNGGLLIKKGVVLSAISDPNLYDKGQNICGKLSGSGGGCKPFITVNSTENSGIYGDGIIDGQGNSVMKGSTKTWWDLASEAKEKNKSQNIPRLIEIKNSKNFVLFNISLKNSPNFHVATSNTNGLTIWGIKINTPADARNTDGIDPGSTENVTITKSYISTGDDNIAIKAGSGKTQHISIINNVFGKGHGMSIGSETSGGVSDILINNLSMNGTTSGLRIKSDISNGGLVNQIYYKNVCIKDVQYPIYLDMHYNKNAVGNKIPKFKDIYFDNVKVLTAGKFVINGLPESKIQVSFNNVKIKKGSTWIKDNFVLSGKITEDASGTTCPDYKK